MNNLFQYTKTEGQGWLVEKPEMDKPNWNSDEYSLFNKYGNKSARYKYEEDLKLYNEHLAALRRFKYDYPDPRKEMELGKDFRTETIMKGPEFTKLTGNPSTLANYTEEVAIPIIKINPYEMNDFDKGFLAGWEACKKEHLSSYPSPKLNEL